MTVTLTYGSESVVLPNPALGNTTTDKYFGVYVDDLGIGFVPTEWSSIEKAQEFSLTFDLLTLAERTSLEAFLASYLGCELTLTNYDGNTYTVISTTQPSFSAGIGDEYSCTLNLIGRST